MNRTLAYLVALSLIMSLAWLSPFQALAQLLSLPGGSLIVTITSPTSGSTVSRTVTVSASVSIVGSLTVAGVQFKLDGSNLEAEDTSAPYSVPWDTTTTSNGSHTLTAVARDILGVLWTSDPVTVTVSNPPTIMNFSPTSGPVGTSVTINGTNFTGATAVTFNGVSASFTVSSASAIQATVPTGATTGPISVTTHGGTATSASAFTVSNADTTPPTVSITSPANGATVSSTITVNATASDNIGVAGVQFQLDGAPLGAEVTVAPYSVTWDTTTTPDGSHTVTLVARDAAGNRATSAGVTVTVSNGGASVTRFEEDNAAISYSPAGAWVRRGPEIAAFSGGYAVSSDVSDATATFTFTGTAVSWIGLKCNICGIASVSIDGAAATSVNTAGAAAPGSPGLSSEVVFTASGLAAGSHTMVITVTGTTTSGGAHVVVDAFDVTGTGGGPPPTTTRIEETDPAISYTGTWIHGSDSRVSGGMYEEASETGARSTLSFTGTAVSWISARGSWAGIANVYVDGTFVGEVDTYAPSEAGEAQVVVFTASGLPRGPHTLTIEVTGTKNEAATFNWIIVDAFDVTS